MFYSVILLLLAPSHHFHPAARHENVIVPSPTFSTRYIYIHVLALFGPNYRRWPNPPFRYNEFSTPGTVPFRGENLGYNSLEKLSRSLRIYSSFFRSLLSFVSKRTYFSSFAFFEGEDGESGQLAAEAFAVLLGREERHAWVGGDAFASWNPVVIPGWRGRALTRCRLNLLEISRQIPGLYPGFRADYVRHCGRSGLRPYRLPCFRTPVMLFPRISTLTLACLRKYLRHWLQKRSCARLNIRAAVSS